MCITHGHSVESNPDNCFPVVPVVFAFLPSTSAHSHDLERAFE